MLYPNEYPTDPLYVQRLSKIHASIQKEDTYHEKLQKYGWEYIPANGDKPDMYVRPSYMGDERKQCTMIEALEENSFYTYPFRNPSHYKSGSYEEHIT